MQYDLFHFPGPPTNGCGATYVSKPLGGDHDPGDRITIRCNRCGKVGEHEVRGRLVGLA